MKKKIAFWMIAAIVICLAAAALFWKNGEGEASVFTAAILEIHDGCYLVEPSEGSAERTSADRIEVPIQSAAPSPEPQVGDTIEIEYSGVLLETYPAQIADVYAIRVTAQAERWDLIPMVMVDGTLYLDTGHTSTATARCGMLDGEITSCVDGASKPPEDDQSNFGAGYGYQYGAEEGTVEIYLNGKWRIFATEEVRDEMTVGGIGVEHQEPPSETGWIPEENTPLTVDSISVLNLPTQKQKEITAAADIHTILTVVSGEWENGMPACDSDMKITLGTEDYWYHSDCGTFLDIHNNRSISLSGEERAEIDRILTE